MKRLYFAVTKRCNLRCAHCFNRSGDGGRDALSCAQVCSVVETARGAGAGEVQLTGGESLAREDIFDIIAYIHAARVSIFLQTNGVIDDNVMRGLLDLDPSYTHIIISLDGFETNTAFRGSQATASTVRSIETLSKRFPTRINTLLSANISDGEILRLIELSEKTGATLAFNPIIPSGRGQMADMAQPQPFFRRMAWIQKVGAHTRKGYGYDARSGLFSDNMDCPVRRNESIFVSDNGDCYPCGFFDGVSQMRMGNLLALSGGFQEIMRRYPGGCGTINGECASCPHYVEKRCFAGCPARIYAIHGHLAGREYYCMKRYGGEATDAGKD